MTVSQESAYTSDMSWKDFMDDEERAELELDKAASDEARLKYNATYKKMKTRCDARMRRHLASTKRSINTQED